MKRIDINVDLGEGFAFDDQLLQIATSANVCCGAHAGTVDLTLETLAKCKSNGVRAGAHPGVPDRENMGRLPLGDTDVAVLSESIRAQIEVAKWDYVKPHGALYNATVVPHGVCAGLIAILLKHDLPLMGMPETQHQKIADMAGVDLIREGFADRLYVDNGLLVPRSESGAVLSDTNDITEQVKVLAEKVDSICIHGDSPGCVEIASLVRATLESEGYEVGS